MYNNNNNHNKLLFSILYYVKKFKIIQIQIIQTHTLIKLYTKMSGKKAGEFFFVCCKTSFKNNLQIIFIRYSCGYYYYYFSV